MTSVVIVGILGVAGLVWLTTPVGCSFALTQDWLVALGWLCPIG